MAARDWARSRPCPEATLRRSTRPGGGSTPTFARTGFPKAASTESKEDNGTASDRRLEPPVVHAGIELAFLDLAAQREGVRVCDLLAKETGAIEIRDPVSCNALLREVDPAALAEEAAAAVAAGYRTVKVKIGAGTPEMDVRRIAAVRKSVGPGIHLRADANGAWDVETAIRALHELEPFDLEYVEQPTATNLATVRGMSRVRIAADESIDSMASAER